VLLESEGGRSPAVHGVARCALPRGFALGELSAVRVGRVTVGTLRERYRLFEVALCMTTAALHRLVLADQRILGLGVVEAIGKDGIGNAFPAENGVA